MAEVADQTAARPVTGADSHDLLDVACEAADAGAAVAMSWSARLESLQVEHKAGPDDLVSQADREAELAIRQILQQRRPADIVVGEEYGGERFGGDRAGAAVSWAVDPIDGTTSYLYGRADWAVSVAALDTSGIVLAGVVMQPALRLTASAARGAGAWENSRRLRISSNVDLPRALIEINLGRASQRPRSGRLLDALVARTRDIRRGGSAAVALANVAAGRADAAWTPGLQEWDCAAGVILVSEAGGMVGDLVGPTSGSVPDSGDVLAAPAELWPDLRTLLADVYADPM